MKSIALTLCFAGLLLCVACSAPEPAAAADPAAAPAAPETAAAPATGPTAVATELVTALSSGDTSAASKNFDSTMRAALTPDKLGQVWPGVVAQLGAFKGQAGTRTEKAGSDDVVFVTCEFERGKVDLQVAVNGAGQVSGLYVVPSRN